MGAALQSDRDMLLAQSDPGQPETWGLTATSAFRKPLFVTSLS